ncbi:MAG: DUF2207 domain-containing protein [Deltaproteobacteria bacterium]|nr:DUF2207 domain-containing protein [Deltaproteobacteria bacterium]
MVQLFLLGGLVFSGVGLLSVLVGLAYAGQNGAMVALGVGIFFIFIGARAFLSFGRYTPKKPGVAVGKVRVALSAKKAAPPE